jgi:hypothetical protein
LQEHMEALSRPVQAFRLLFSAPRYSPK